MDAPAMLPPQIGWTAPAFRVRPRTRMHRAVRSLVRVRAGDSARVGCAAISHRHWSTGSCALAGLPRRCEDFAPFYDVSSSRSAPRRAVARGVGGSLTREARSSQLARCCAGRGRATGGCPVRPPLPILGPVAPPALDQCVVEHRLVVVFAGDYDALVPGPEVDDPLVVDLGAEALGVDGGQGVAGAVHAASAVAAADDRDELVCLLVVGWRWQ